MIKNPDPKSIVGLDGEKNMAVSASIAKGVSITCSSWGGDGESAAFSSVGLLCGYRDDAHGGSTGPVQVDLCSECLH